MEGVINTTDTIEVKAEGQRPISLEAVAEPVKRHLEALDDLFEEQVSAFEPEVQDLVWYVFRHRGKRIRPMLVFYSGWGSEGVLSDDLVKVACVIELIHMATLIHDDILDEASLRHRCVTLNRKFGSKEAVLLGDALFSHALKLATEFSTTEVCRAVAQATRRVCCGEIRQTFCQGDREISLEDYYKIIDLKTAELFNVSCYLGALMGGGAQDYVEGVSVFGRQVGIAFQIYDDLADILDNEEKMGKTLGTDLATKKYTLPMLLLFKKLKDGKEGGSLLSALEAGASNVLDVRKLLVENGILNEVRAVFMERLSKAVLAIRPFEGEQSCLHLIDIKDLMSIQMERLLVF